MYLVACGVIGFGDLIWDTESGRPFGMSTERLKLSRRDSRRELDELCLLSFEDVLDRRSEDECLEDDDDEVLEDDEDLWEEDFSDGTSRMLRMRPVVGSVVEDWAGSCDTW